MIVAIGVIGRVVVTTLTCAFSLVPAARGQTPSGSPTQDQAAVFRANTELVQTDAMVFDDDGRFVSGLRVEDFELRIDGKVRPVAFFERIAAGTAHEQSPLTATRGVPWSTGNAPVAAAPVDRGRTVFFYVDDLHLDIGSLNTTTKIISDFIEEEMGQDDEVAIGSASGQVGFLQQLTDNKVVLRSALQRIKLRPNSVRDVERPPMSEYQALLIDGYDRDVTEFFVQEVLRQNRFMTREQAESLVKGRARVLDRLPYAADLSLADLPPGRYVLQVTVMDRVATTSASQQTRIEIQ